MKISEQDKVHLEWYKRSSKSMTEEEMKKFNDELFNDHHHDYGTICHAVAASTLTHLNNLLYKESMTGLQSSFVMWEIIQRMFNIEVGAMLIKFDDMLYPQYEYKFNSNTIDNNTFKLLQEKAQERMDESGLMTSRVRHHMQSIVDGKIPFGYELETKED